MTDFQVPSWGYWVMGIGFIVFIALLVAYSGRSLPRPTCCG